MARHLVAVLCVLVATACGSNTLTRTGTTYPPRERTCDFDVFTTPPASGYTEIATLDMERGFWGDNAHRDTADLKEAIQPSVCEAGGDAVIAYANGLGRYIKASVLKRTSKPAAQTAAVQPAPIPATPAATAEAGCQYDTQCKGDRVCVAGQCVNPAPSTTTAAASDSVPTVAPQ